MKEIEQNIDTYIEDPSRLLVAHHFFFLHPFEEDIAGDEIIFSIIRDLRLDNNNLLHRNQVSLFEILQGGFPYLELKSLHINDLEEVRYKIKSMNIQDSKILSQFLDCYNNSSLCNDTDIKGYEYKELREYLFLNNFSNLTLDISNTSPKNIKEVYKNIIEKNKYSDKKIRRFIDLMRVYEKPNGRIVIPAVDFSKLDPEYIRILKYLEVRGLIQYHNEVFDYDTLYFTISPSIIKIKPKTKKIALGFKIFLENIYNKDDLQNRANKLLKLFIDNNFRVTRKKLLKLFTTDSSFQAAKKELQKSVSGLIITPVKNPNNGQVVDSYILSDNR